MAVLAGLNQTCLSFLLNLKFNIVALKTAEHNDRLCAHACMGPAYETIQALVTMGVLARVCIPCRATVDHLIACLPI